MARNGQVQEEAAPPTEDEVAIAKAESRLERMKHIDARDLGLQIIFPLLRRLAQTSGDQGETIEDLVEAIEVLEARESGGEDPDLLSGARDIILSFAKLLDETMVAAGFFNVTEKGLLATDKVPANIASAYVAIGKEAATIAEALQIAIDSADDDDDDDDDGDGDGEGEVEGEVADAPTSVTLDGEGVLNENKEAGNGTA